MPPKKKGAGGGKKGGGGTGGIVDAVPTEEMTREQLEQHVYRLREELEREREERNYFEVERDKLHTFLEIMRKRLEEKQAEAMNKDRDLEEAQEKHDVEIKVYKQKVKHLLYEQQNSLAELKAENMVSLKTAEDEHMEQEGELLKDKLDLKTLFREQELANQDTLRGLKMKHAESLSALRGEFERESRDIEVKYEKRLGTLRYELDLKARMELTEVEERKNKQIAELMLNHEKAFSDIKNYYNDITLNNLALINTLKDQVEEMKNKEERLEKQVHELTGENKNLSEPLKAAQEEVYELRRQMQNYEKDKTSLQNTKIRLKTVTRELDELKWENEVLEGRFGKLEKERNDLRDRFSSAILDLQQRSGLRRLLLEKKLNTLSELLEQKEAQLQEVLAAANLDPSATAAVNRKLEELLERKNTAVRDLQFELARVCKAHDDLLATYEGKLKKLGIPQENLGFTPLRATVAGRPLSKAPAGLVAAQP